MNTTAKLAIGGVAVVVVAFLGIGFSCPVGHRIDGPTPTLSTKLARAGPMTNARRGHLRHDSLPRGRSDALHRHRPRASGGGAFR